MYVARKFSPAEYGELIALIALSFIIVSFFDFGLPVYFQREVSRLQNIHSLYKTTLILYLILFPVYIGICFLYSHFFQSFNSILIFITIVVSSYLSLYTNVMSKIVSGLRDFKSQFYFLVLSRCFFLFFPIAYLFKKELTIESVAVVLLLSYFFNLILFYYYLKRNYFKSESGAVNFNLLGKIIKVSIPLGVIVLVNLLYDRIDVLLISKLLGFSDTGKYNIAYGLLKASTLSFSFILIEGFSKASYLSSKISSIKLFLRKYIIIIFSISCISALVLFFLPDFLVTFFYTTKYSNSIVLLKFLSFAVIPLALNNLTGITLNALGKFNFVLIATIVGLIVNVTLNVILIPSIGLIAACYATFFTEIVILIVESIFLFKVLNKK
ncbi:MAG: oligosaccharide flippase family protein [Bacteroidetes bacterium]|nr:oligosaccharide flippase family protein [Bacteroidota bacterium]